jgi:hypothetical protein
MSSYNFDAVQAATDNWVSKSDYKFHETEPNNIAMFTNGAEMIRVTQDGFWVRGVKIEQDEREAETVYNAFKSFLMWAELNRK